MPLFTLSILFFSVLSFIFPGLASMLIFDRQAIAMGQFWRLPTCHLVHFSSAHLIYNLLAFGIAGAYLERKNLLAAVVLYTLGGLVVGLALFRLAPGMQYYGGLSSLACGAIFYHALSAAGSPGLQGMVSKLIALGLLIKIAIEFHGHTSVLHNWGPQTFVTMPLGHMAGMVTALLLFALLRGQARTPIRPPLFSRREQNQ